MKTADLLLVGGGLASGLLALRLKEAKPALRVVILEKEARLGGNHTWSFHDNDLSGEQRKFLRPMVAHHWPHQSVRFPGLERTLSAGYNSIPSGRFHDVLTKALGEDQIRFNAPVREIAATSVRLDDGTELEAGAVVDASGFKPDPALRIRFQSFLGLELRIAGGHGLAMPVIMDATTPQDSGYRFTYLLPFSADTVLVEDTGYLDDAALDIAGLERRIADYCSGRNWTVQEVVRREQGVLPIALAGDPAHRNRQHAAPQIGLAGAFFHPTTGYSLPDAVRVADVVAALDQLTPDALRQRIDTLSAALWRDRRFFRALNRMLFLAGRPEDRWRVMQRFYRLPQPLI
ncbi:MAG TPA: lycopene beta-cyclase CrtY, partial [Tianweitania sediminis]|nr:lycopene beta-cyclase CrtY [Tianweitania sediminis]